MGIYADSKEFISIYGEERVVDIIKGQLRYTCICLIIKYLMLMCAFKTCGHDSRDKLDVHVYRFNRTQGRNCGELPLFEDKKKFLASSDSAYT